jgi:hypothetical protein
VKLDELQFVGGEERYGGYLELLGEPSSSMRRFHVRCEDVADLFNDRKRQEARNDRRLEETDRDITILRYEDLPRGIQGCPQQARAERLDVERTPAKVRIRGLRPDVLKERVHPLYNGFRI